MKTTIKVKVLTVGCMPKIIKKGEWIDLVCAETTEIKAAQAGVQYQKNGDKYRDVETLVTYIPLGVAMQLPKGYEAVVIPRSSLADKLGIVQSNSVGLIDSSYCGNDDEWKLPVVPIRNTFIEKGTRVCQFRIQLSQKATMWQRIKWLFSNGIKLVKVDNLKGKNRSGFGSTGLK